MIMHIAKNCSSEQSEAILEMLYILKARVGSKGCQQALEESTPLLVLRGARRSYRCFALKKQGLVARA